MKLLQDRIMSKVEIMDLYWLGELKNGYGYLSVKGKRG